MKLRRPAPGAADAERRARSWRCWPRRERARDRFLLALLAETGMRVGQALGLRHADFVSRAKEVRIVPRERQRQRRPGQAALAGGDPGHRRAGAAATRTTCTASTATSTPTTCSSTCGSGRIGAPMTYAAVHELVGRIRARTGVEFTLHMLRHTHATELIRSGVAIEVVARLLTHQSSTTTSQTYVHLDVADVRDALQRAGVWERAGAGAVTAAGAARHLRARPEVLAGAGDGRGRVRQGHLGRRAARRAGSTRSQPRPLRRDRPALAAGGDQAVVAGSASPPATPSRTIDAGAQALARFSLFLAERPEVVRLRRHHPGAAGGLPVVDGRRATVVDQHPLTDAHLREGVPRLGPPPRHPARPAGRRRDLRGGGQPPARRSCPSSSPSS